MNLRDLNYLVTLADLKHFGRAAEACFVSQPTLSTQIRKLEEELGVQLIERAPRNLMLTEVGASIVERARGVLRDVEQIRESARRAADPANATIRLGLFPTLGPYFLPHAMPRIIEAFPGLECLLYEEKTPSILDGLRKGRLDAALLALPVEAAGLETEELFTEPFVMALPASHPLSKQTSISIEQLERHSVLLLEDGHCLRDQALEVCQLSGANERPGFRATSLETLRQMVGAGVGITLLPLLATLPPISTPADVSLIPFKAPVPHRTIGLVWRRSAAAADFFPKLATVLRNSVKKVLE